MFNRFIRSDLSDRVWRELLLLVYTLLSIGLLNMTGCRSDIPSGTFAGSSAPSKTVILVTTTTIRDTGLLDALVPRFEATTRYHLQAVVVGSGQALALGERGEADVLLTHAPASEATFMQAGNGISRKLVMHNDFILVGPPSDPAHIKDASSTTEAVRRIATTKATFISRGENSGTDQIEKGLWKAAVIDTNDQRWYLETGLGQSATLLVASEKQAYSLTDRGTYLKVRHSLNLDILFHGDPTLTNVYHVIQVNPQKSSKINTLGGKAFTDFMISPATQQFIGNFGVAEFGQSLFIPDAGKNETDVSS